MTTTARSPFVVPRPTPCPACNRGCPQCDWSAVESAWFRLQPSRTFAYRHVIYRPSAFRGCGKLKVRTARNEGGGKLSVNEYAVREFPCDFAGRAFAVEKVGTQRRHECFLGFDGSVSCSCEGETYQSAAKANQRAHDEGSETFATKGCVHLDSLCALMGAGWLDVENKAAVA